MEDQRESGGVSPDTCSAVAWGAEPHDEACLMLALPRSSTETHVMHVVFDRHLTAHQWIQFGHLADGCWDGAHQTWDMEGLVQVMKIVSGAQVRRMERLDLETFLANTGLIDEETRGS